MDGGGRWVLAKVVVEDGGIPKNVEKNLCMDNERVTNASFFEPSPLPSNLLV